MGAIYCAEHMPVAQGSTTATPPPPFDVADPGPYAWDAHTAVPPNATLPSPYSAPANRVSPGVALALGMIPGVGAIYNGQYAKGLIHAVIFGLLITIVSNGSEALAPLVGILIAVWWFYMVLEAFHTARKRRDGLAVDEFSSILTLHAHRTGFPFGALLLIGLGMILLLDTTGLVPLHFLLRFWPVALILLGVYMLYGRRSNDSLSQEFSDERR